MTEQTQTLVKQEEQSPESVYHIDSTPEAIDSNSWMTSYSDLFYNDTDNYWEPPISRTGLADIARANAYHGSLLIARANYVAGRFLQGGSTRRRHIREEPEAPKAVASLPRAHALASSLTFDFF